MFFTSQTEPNSAQWPFNASLKTAPCCCWKRCSYADRVKQTRFEVVVRQPNPELKLIIKLRAKRSHTLSLQRHHKHCVYVFIAYTIIKNTDLKIVWCFNPEPYKKHYQSKPVYLSIVCTEKKGLVSPPSPLSANNLTSFHYVTAEHSAFLQTQTPPGLLNINAFIHDCMFCSFI